MLIRGFFFGLLCFAIISCNDDDYPYADVPSVALNKFLAVYPDAKDVSWKQVAEDYEVDFEVEDVEMKALISTSGELLRQKTEIDISDLPAPVMQVLNDQFGREKIDNPEKVTAGEQTFYQVEIERFFLDDEIVIDENGNLMETKTYWD